MSLIHNERWKLTATWVNAVGVGIVIAGSVTPIVALAYGLRAGPQPIGAGTIIVLTLVWILIGLALHLMARALLGRLRE
jgi:hypothetical protein